MFNLPSMPWPARGLAFTVPAIAAMMTLSARRPRAISSLRRTSHIASRAPDREAHPRLIDRSSSTDGLWQHLGVTQGRAERVACLLDWLYALPETAWRSVEAEQVPRNIERELDALVRSQHLALARWIIRDEVTSARLQTRWRNVRAADATEWDAFWVAAEHAAAALLVADTLSHDTLVRLTSAFVDAIPATVNPAG